MEEVLDWAAYLEYLQALLKVFDLTAAFNKAAVISYFRKELRPSIQAPLDHQGWNLDLWKEVV